MHIYILTYAHTCMHAWMHTYILVHACIHTYTHTFTQADASTNRKTHIKIFVHRRQLSSHGLRQLRVTKSNQQINSGHEAYERQHISSANWSNNVFTSRYIHTWTYTCMCMWYMKTTVNGRLNVIGRERADRALIGSESQLKHAKQLASLKKNPHEPIKTSKI